MTTLFPEIDGAIKFFIDAEPVAQPRQRHAYSKGLGRVINYIPRDHPIYVFKQVCQARAKLAYQGKPLLGPLEVHVLFRLSRPVAFPKKTPGRIWAPGPPDIDNYEKAVYDALKGILWKDDSQIVDSHARKLYASAEEECGVEIMVQELA